MIGRRKASFVIAMIASVATLSGCGNNGEEAGMESTMTIREAVAQVDSYMEGARAALGQGTKFTQDFRKDNVECDNPDGPSAQVFATRKARVIHLSESQPEEIFDSIRKWWNKNNFRETDSEEDVLYAKNHSNGFRMSIETNPKGEYHMGFSSPCVWPNGTPESQD